MRMHSTAFPFRSNRRTSSEGGELMRWSKWHWLVGSVSVIELVWAARDWFEFRSVGAAADNTNIYILSALGLSGLLSLRWKKLALLSVALHSLAIVVAMRLIPISILAIRQPAPGTGVGILPISPTIGLMILTLCGSVILLSLLAILGNWKLFRQSRKLAA